MKYMAQWGPKGFLVSPGKIIPLKGLSTRLALKSDSENDTSGTAPTNTRGRDLQKITFTTDYIRAVGTDPMAQWNEWETLLGEKYPLYIGGKRFGPELMKLTVAELTDMQLTNSGEVSSLSVKITLEEYSEGQTSKLKSSTKKKTSTMAAVYAETIAKKTAMNATASAEDRAKKLPLHRSVVKE